MANISILTFSRLLIAPVSLVTKTNPIPRMKSLNQVSTLGLNRIFPCRMSGGCSFTVGNLTS